MTGTAIAGATATTTAAERIDLGYHQRSDSLTIDGKTIAFTSSSGNTIAASGANGSI